MVKKTYVRKVRKIGKRIYKKVIHPYVNKKKGYKNRMKLYNEIQQIKRVINAEKKEILTYINNTTLSIGQINQNTDNAYWQQDITPIIPQGAQDGQRNGDSVRLNSMLIKGAFIQQANCVLPVKVRVFIVSVKGTPESVNINNFLVQNPITGCTDMNSVRNKDRYANYSIITTKTFAVRSDQYSGQGNMFRNFSIPLKFSKRHIHYLQNTNTVSRGQILMYVVCDSGNINAAASSNTVIPVTGAQTGVAMRYSCDAWYYDN